MNQPRVEDSPARVQTLEATAGHGGADTVISSDDIRREQLSDDNLSPVIKLLKDKSQPSHADICQYPDESRVLLAQWDSLFIENDILYRRFHHPDGSTNFLQTILPASLRRPYIERLHSDLGHFGQVKTSMAASRRIYFPGWRSFTKLVVRIVRPVIYITWM